MFTDYNTAIEYLYSQLPTFHKQGAGAYKPGLDTARTLDAAFGNPSQQLRTVHIAGTNGKGSTAHSLAAILMQAGYRTGLYTSPHIHDFRERIRINGAMIPHSDVVDFINRYQAMHLDVNPSFFELTTIMAFEYFVKQNVDVAIIETGLGGRLDTTNIITPLLSIITNISLDHTSLLGDTPGQIAAEKAGIIKPDVPVVIGRADDADVKKVFIETARRQNAPIYFTPQLEATITSDGIDYHNTPVGDFTGQLSGAYQVENTATVLTATELLTKHFDISRDDIVLALEHVADSTGLRGRWTKLSSSPLTIYDTGHNPGGWTQITAQLAHFSPAHIHLIAGFVADKDITTILDMISDLSGTPGITLKLYAAAPSTPRRLDAEALAQQALAAGIDTEVITDVNEALACARACAAPDDIIFIGGSNFLISDLKEISGTTL